MSRKSEVTLRAVQPSLPGGPDGQLQRIYCREMSPAGDTQSGLARGPRHRAPGGQPGTELLIPERVSPLALAIA